MKLATFSNRQGGECLGIISGEQIIDVAAAHGAEAPAFASMLALIRAGDEALGRVREIEKKPPAHAVQDLGDVRLLCPLPVPEQVRCFSAFEAHVRNSGAVMLKKMAALAADPVAEEKRLAATGNFGVPPIFFERPLYYKANRFNWVGPNQAVTWPAYSQVVDHELELACIIGKRGRDISKENARAHIFGFSICNDLSARDAQALEMRAPLGPAKGKDFDGGNIMGPCIVTADDIDPYALDMIVRVNGQERARGFSGDIHHRFEDMIAYVTASETIHPGEMLLSGCVGGGSASELGLTCARGDIIEFEISGIGVLTNPIV